MPKIRSWPRDEKGHDIKPSCIDPAAIERDYDRKITRLCRFRHASGSTCYRRWAGTNGPQNPCPIREMHMISPRRKAEKEKEDAGVPA